MVSTVNVRQIALHEGTHFDEIAAVVLLKLYGERQFPGVGTAPVVFWAHGGATPDGRPAGEWVKRGVLPLGQGFGQFDEHPCPQRAIRRKAGQSTASLVATALGFGSENQSSTGRAVNYLIKLVTDQDLHGNTGGPLGLEQTLSAMHRVKQSSELMFEWGRTAVEVLLADQIALQKEYDRAAGGEHRCQRVGGYQVAVIESGSEYACKVALMRGAHLVLRHDPETRHVTIMKRHEVPIPMDQIVANLRRAELRAQALVPPNEDWTSEGRLAGWYFHPNISLITTGGNRAARLTKPSIMPWPRIQEIVISFLLLSEVRVARPPACLQAVSPSR
ncbi:MAG: hypothetical protein HYT46_01915 [Candidatus Vogelbacteria bacterium]|nr:hypothetical protein [Candidatus Vogelbacteria bacterium]